jgi:hypothetical protein
VPDTAALARLARLSNGLLKRQHISRSGRVHEFRTAGATGARYHLELYFVCGDLPDLPTGDYHYATNDQRRGRPARRDRGRQRRRVQPIAGTGHPRATSMFWRNAWREKARGYRNTFWDAGTSLANLLAVVASLEQFDVETVPRTFWAAQI